MSDCPSCGTPARHTAIRIPWNGSQRIQVEHICEKYGCKTRLIPWFEDSLDEDAVLLKVLGARPGVRVHRSVGDGVQSAFKGCLVTCRYYQAPPGPMASAGATVVHAEGCPWLRMPR